MTGGSEAGWHSIVDFYRCPKRYQFSTVRKLRALSEPEETPMALAVGVLTHAGRAAWLEAKQPTWSETTDKLIADAIQKAAEEEPRAIRVEAENEARFLLYHYVNHWAKLPRIQPVGIEYKLGPAPVKKDDPFFLYRTGRLDDVSKYPEFANALCIGDLKTSSVSVNHLATEYKLHGQLYLYATLWKLAPQGEKVHGPIKGAVIDGIVKSYEREGGKRKPPTFGRAFIPINQFAVNWFAEELRNKLQQAASIRRDSVVERRITACTYTVGRKLVECPYQTLCRLGPAARSQFVDPDGKVPSLEDAS